MEISRKCTVCLKPLVRKKNESNKLFEKRVTCSRNCTYKNRRLTKTDKNCFRSNFGGGWITRANYLGESMCNRKAMLKKTKLPNNFWNLNEWKSEYKSQVFFASKLLKKFSIESIIKALKTEKGKRVYSLGAPWLEPIIKEQQLKYETTKETLKSAEVTILPENNESVRPAFISSESPLSKLRGL